MGESLCRTQDVFQLSSTDVGDVERIKIWHDGRGLASGWHLQQVKVHSSTTGQTYTFPCNAWLQKTRDAPMGHVKELLEGVDADGDASYTLRVYTSDLRGAGTDGDVSCVIFGDSGDTGASTCHTACSWRMACPASAGVATQPPRGQHARYMFSGLPTRQQCAFMVSFAKQPAHVCVCSSTGRHTAQGCVPTQCWTQMYRRLVIACWGVLDTALLQGHSS